MEMTAKAWRQRLPGSYWGSKAAFTCMLVSLLWKILHALLGHLLLLLVSSLLCLSLLFLPPDHQADWGKPSYKVFNQPSEVPD